MDHSACESPSEFYRLPKEAEGGRHPYTATHRRTTKKAENRIQFSISELAVQVSRSGFPCDSERKVCPGHRSCCGNCRILVPPIAVAGSENCRQDVGASKCWQGRDIEHREEEKPQCSQVAEHRGTDWFRRRTTPDRRR